MKIAKTTTALAVATLLGFASAAGAQTTSAPNAAGTTAAQGSMGSTPTATGAANNTNSLVDPASRTIGRGATSSAEPVGRWQFWRKEWWQQHAQNGRVTRQQYMDQMSRRWDEIDRSGAGSVAPDDLARAFGDETTVAPSGVPRAGTNDAGRSAGKSAIDTPTTNPNRLGAGGNASTSGATSNNDTSGSVK